MSTYDGDIKDMVFKVLDNWLSKMSEGFLLESNITLDQISEVIDKLKTLGDEDHSKEETLPSFIFEIKNDGTHLSPEPHKPFLCVYEFCVALEMFCKSRKMDIEKHWDRMLLKTSAHNSDRFMWIHVNLINLPAARLTWEQIVQRLMLKYDDPKRTQSVKRALDSFSFDPNKSSESIESANRRFVAYVLETHCDTSMAIPLYVNGMPEMCKKLLNLTMAYDRSSGFNYCVKDIVQRSSTFIHSKNDDYVFYSKTARIAVTLPMEKVYSKICEFHLSTDHSTATCPDYSVLKYPYIDPMAIDNEFYAALTQENEPLVKTEPDQEAHPSYIPTTNTTRDVQIKREPVSKPSYTPYGRPRSNRQQTDQCIFCKLPFYHGHLNDCKKVIKKKK